ncbi:hypothetical protein [Nostoc sp. C117]|uniref:hypothetical protein n=1 Tax=Nostoc sp. C117 TaxID=3349875 RepID=UPI00370D8F4B
MTTDRLDRIEEILAQTTTLARENAVAISELRSTVNSLVQIVEVHQHNFEVSQRNFEVIMSEIRGLRTESQRILEHLFGREENRE